MANAIERSANRVASSNTAFLGLSAWSLVHPQQSTMSEPQELLHQSRNIAVNDEPHEQNDQHEADRLNLLA